MSDDRFSRSYFDFFRQLGKTITLTVATGSMMPLIRPGDRVGIRLVNAVNVKSGDVVAFHQGSEIIVHRVLRVEKQAAGRIFQQKGDAGPGWGCFSEEALMGQVETLYRGNAVLQMNAPPWSFYNRLMGVLGFLKCRLFQKARTINYRGIGERQIPVFRWLLRMETVGTRRLQRLLIRAGLSL